jgi:hypothetical protein
MSHSLQIAIIEYDKPIDDVKARYGTYGDRFASLLTNSLTKTTGTEQKSRLEVGKYDAITGEYPDLQQIDGILMTGSSVYYHETMAPKNLC